MERVHLLPEPAAGAAGAPDGGGAGRCLAVQLYPPDNSIDSYRRVGKARARAQGLLLHRSVGRRLGVCTGKKE